MGVKRYKKYRNSSRNINILLLKEKFNYKEEKRFDKSNFFIWSLIVLLFVFASIFFNYVLMPRIDLKGKSSIDINYKEKYKELGYKAIFQGRDISDEVKVNGKVDSNKLGVYKIVYKVKYGAFSKKITRRVTVKDMIEPDIEVSSPKKIYVCPGKKYKNYEYKAIDNYDGDITNKVKVKMRNNYILYEVSDSSGNKRVLKKDILYEDKAKPKIILNGSDIVYSFIGEEYKDSYKASDNCDGDITDKVIVTGKVNNNVAGSYRLTYKVTDEAGNTTVSERMVIVSERGINGTIYLTFDDGPRSGTTDLILDILKEEGVKATFFVTNSGPDELIKREFDEGHTIALHTSSHDYSYVYSSVDNYFNDLNTVYDRVKRITGKESKIVRFPGGSSNTISRRYSPGIMTTLTSEILNKGYKYYDWNLDSGDAEYKNHSKEDIVNRVINNLSKERVNMILMHDVKSYTKDALKDIIRYGKENGYIFENITESTEMVTQRVNN